MTNKPFSFLIVGFVFGLATAIVALRYCAPEVLFQENDSSYGFEESVALLEKAASDNGWVIPKQYRLDMSLKKAGYDILPVSVIELCRPEHAAKILGQDKFMHFSTMMPCRVAVYQKSDGTVSIARMNTRLMSHFFDPDVETVMMEATGETEHIIDAISTH